MSELRPEFVMILQQSFDRMDVNGDGIITKDELKGLLEGVGEE